MEKCTHKNFRMFSRSNGHILSPSNALFRLVNPPSLYDTLLVHSSKFRVAPVPIGIINGSMMQSEITRDMRGKMGRDFKFVELILLILNS
jgi:hypothetical protein